MREWCSCGAAIRAPKRTVIQWRTGHQHGSAEPEREPDKQGTEAHTETAWRPTATDDGQRIIPDITARIGFQPNT